jgi:hypothetical protein
VLCCAEVQRTVQDTHATVTAHIAAGAVNRFELRKDQEAASVILPRPDGSVVDIKPAVMNGEGNIINNHDHW